MKTISALLLAALAASACAQEGADNLFEAGPEAKAGDIVPRSFLATADMEVCDDLQANIHALKGELEGDTLRAAEPAPRAYKIGTSCILSFNGGDQLKTEVSRMAGVNSIEPNKVMTAMAPPSWGLDRIDQPDLPLDKADWNHPYAGSGEDIYIVDTGIWATHEDFGGRAVYGGDFVNEGFPEDRRGHGTHCAGTAGGTLYGVAKEANLIGVKVLNSTGQGTGEAIIAGVEWSVTNAGGKPSVISMSLGGPNMPAVDEAVLAAAAAGMIVVVAAGNGSTDACKRSPAAAGGDGPNTGMITVGSTTTNDGLSYFSNRGVCVDMHAPGTNIKSAWSGSDTATDTVSGTSMATPHVAGVAAVCLEMNDGNKEAALSCIFDNAVKDKINNPKEGPNLIIQMPPFGIVPTKSPVSSPTPPTPTPPTPTPPTPTPPTPTPPTPTPPACEDNPTYGCSGRSWFCWVGDVRNNCPVTCGTCSSVAASDFSSAEAEEPTSNVGAVAGAVGASAAFVALAAGLVIHRRRRASEEASKQEITSPELDL